MVALELKETRETRISEYHSLPGVTPPPVLGLREGSWLRVNDDKILLEGHFPQQTARLFVRDTPTKEIELGTDLSVLLK